MEITEGMALEYSPGFSAESIEEDRRLVKEAKRDVNAFGDLYDKYYDPISRYVYHRTLDRALTEDLTANTFFAAFRHIGRFRWQGAPFGAWLYRIATNEIRKHYRKQNRSPIDSSAPREDDEHLRSKSAVSPHSAIGDDLLAAEEHARLHHAILSLKPTYQTVITLRFFEEKSMREISEIVGRKEGTVKSQLHRGLKKLRNALKPYHSTSSPLGGET